MSESTYRYRAVHAMAERFLALASRYLPQRPGPVAGEPPRRILVIKFGGMGEAVLARSLVERLQERHPEMTFDFLVESRTIETMTVGRSGLPLKYSPGSDGIAAALAILRKVRGRRYDALLDFEQHSLLTAAFARATSIPIRVGFLPSEPNSRGQMFTHTIQLREDESMWCAFVRLGQVLDSGLPDDLMTVPLPVSEEVGRWMGDWWSAQMENLCDGPVLALHLGVGPSAQYRRWPVERFAELATALRGLYPRLVVILTGTKSEGQLFTEFRGLLGGRIIEALDLGGLEYTCALLHRCDVLVSADTGIMHLAAAMGTPTVGLFGPNTPACWGPVGPFATSVYWTRLPCSPCINSYRRHIPATCTAVRKSACMWDIQVESVLTAILAVSSKYHRPTEDVLGFR